MRDQREKILKNVSDTIKIYFPTSTFIELKHKVGNVFRISSNNLSYAINVRKNEREKVKVIKWFDDFWLYFEIKYYPSQKGKEFSANITISIFQGISEDEIKTQLFRAEWENFTNNNIHPQPHWHIYPFKYESKYHEDFEKFMKFKAEDVGFENIIKQTNKTNLININDFHFAINGNWIKEDENHIHELKNAEDLFKWLYGILGHIKSQLEYVKQ